ncbi:MAG: hypothetical protein IJ188_09760 [Clostridia bacterium]|nr:hypothetical protein [Clostridia bacterium]
MIREKLKEPLIRIVRLYTLQVTLISVLLIILGKLLDSSRVFSYEAFFSPLLYALIGTLATLITHTDKEISMKGLIIRKVVTLLLVEAAIIFIAVRSDTIPTEQKWVIPGIAIGIIVVFLLSNIIMYFSDKKEARKLSADIVRYQREYLKGKQ